MTLSQFFTGHYIITITMFETKAENYFNVILAKKIKLYIVEI